MLFVHGNPARLLTRSFRRTAKACRSFSTIPVQTSSSTHDPSTDLENFRQQALIPQAPFLFKKQAGSPTSRLPAADKWFTHISAPLGSNETQLGRLSSYLEEFQDWPFPYELWAPKSDQTPSVAAFRDSLNSSPDMMDGILAGILQSTLEQYPGQAFFQLHAPLRLLRRALEFNEQVSVGMQPVQLYIAQSSITDLPDALQHDLPTPKIVQEAGTGDVYSSSVWLGTEPTYTPLHRDPNPNLFCQLCSSKVVRLLPPAMGERLFFEVQTQIRQQASSRIRTAEMMEGKEREVLNRAVWDPEVQLDQLFEADVADGDALFVPKGWWHSVKSTAADGKLNASVNWWFR